MSSCGDILYSLRSLANLSIIHLNSSLASSLDDVLERILWRAHPSIASNFLISGTSKFRHIIICTIDSERVRKSCTWNSCTYNSQISKTWHAYQYICSLLQYYKFKRTFLPGLGLEHWNSCFPWKYTTVSWSRLRYCERLDLSLVLVILTLSDLNLFKEIRKRNFKT